MVQKIVPLLSVVTVFLRLVLSSVVIFVQRCRPPLLSVGNVAIYVVVMVVVVAAWFGCQSPSAAGVRFAVCCPLLSLVVVVFAPRL